MPQLRRRSLPLAALALLGACARSPAPSQQLDRTTAARIDDLFELYDNPHVPGCNVGVARDGHLIYQRSFGSADLDYATPNAADTRFPIGSNSKQFTAMVVALLAEDGKLSLDDDVRKWVPELPVYEKPIAVRDLLHHTSGLRDYQALRFLSGTPPDYLDLDWVVGLLAKQRGTHFPAGTEFEYSNSNYVLARVVAERASGRTISQLARERIFAPLGMRSTVWDETGKRTVPHRATPYAGSLATGWRRSFGATLAGSGGIWTTVEDLLRWDENFYKNRLGRRDPGLVRRAVTPSPASTQARGAVGEEARDGGGMGLFLGRHHLHRRPPLPSRQHRRPRARRAERSRGGRRTPRALRTVAAASSSRHRGRLLEYGHRHHLDPARRHRVPREERPTRRRRRLPALGHRTRRGLPHRPTPRLARHRRPRRHPQGPPSDTLRGRPRDSPLRPPRRPSSCRYARRLHRHLRQRRARQPLHPPSRKRRTATRHPPPAQRHAAVRRPRPLRPPHRLVHPDPHLHPRRTPQRRRLPSRQRRRERPPLRAPCIVRLRSAAGWTA